MENLTPMLTLLLHRENTTINVTKVMYTCMKKWPCVRIFESLSCFLALLYLECNYTSSETIKILQHTKTVIQPTPHLHVSGATGGPNSWQVSSGPVSKTPSESLPYERSLNVSRNWIDCCKTGVPSSAGGCMLKQGYSQRPVVSLKLWPWNMYDATGELGSKHIHQK